jgi:hypothetical protein
MCQVHLRADILEGLRAVFSHRILRPVFIAATVGAFAGQLQAAVLVLFFVRDLPLSSSLVGVAIAVSGVAAMLGATLATWFTRRVGPGRAFITCMLLASVAGIVLASAVGPFAVSLAILLLSQVLRGAAPSIYGVNQQTFRQVLIAPRCCLAPTRRGASWPLGGSRWAPCWVACWDRCRASGDADREQLHHVGRHDDRICVAVTLASHALRKRGRRREDGGSARVALLGR